MDVCVCVRVRDWVGPNLCASLCSSPQTDAWTCVCVLPGPSPQTFLVGYVLFSVPQAVDLWLALAYQETYENAKVVSVYRG